MKSLLLAVKSEPEPAGLHQPPKEVQMGQLARAEDIAALSVAGTQRVQRGLSPG